MVTQEFKKELPGWFTIQEPTNKTYQKILEALLDKGEASAIARSRIQTLGLTLSISSVELVDFGTWLSTRISF